MMTTRQLINRLRQLDPNLPVVIRMDGFEWKDGPHDVHGIPTEVLDHSELLSDQAHLDAADIEQVWRHEYDRATVEISVRVASSFSFCHCCQEPLELRLLNAAAVSELQVNPK